MWFRKKEQPTSPIRTGQGEDNAKQAAQRTSQSTISCIKVLGTGCKACHGQYENAKQAVKNMGLMIAVEYITDLEQIMSYGAMRMPAIVVNEQVVSMGKALRADELEKLLRQLGFCPST